MENRKRDIQIIVRVTEEGRALIEEKMKLLPTQNLSAYTRKMLIDGYIIQLDMAEVKAHAAHGRSLEVGTAVTFAIQAAYKMRVWDTPCVLAE